MYSYRTSLRVDKTRSTELRSRRIHRPRRRTTCLLMEKPKQQQQKKNGRSRSFSGGGWVSFLRSTVASFSSTYPSTSSRGRSSFNHRNAFSGPIISIVPPEARGGGRRRQSSSASGYRTPEPSSPKVSCIGQVKRSRSKRAAAKVNPSCGKNGGACPLPPLPPSAADAGRCTRPAKGSLVRRVLFRRSRSRSRSRDGCSGGTRGVKGVVAKAPAPAPAPAGGLGQMKRFTSGRAAFQDFDWREVETRVHDVDEEEDEGFVAHSAPLVLGGGVVASEPKKEVNLWRRRPIAPPTPLQLP